MKKDVVQTIVAILVIVGMAIGAMSYFAKADELRLVELRLDQKIISDRIAQTQNRIWQLEDRHKGMPCSQWQDQSDKHEYRQLKEQVDQLKKHLDNLIKNK